jgi:hypothetical protein
MSFPLDIELKYKLGIKGDEITFQTHKELDIFVNKLINAFGDSFFTNPLYMYENIFI